MNKKSSLIILVLSFLGIIDAGYLTYEHYATSVQLFCPTNAVVNCEAMLQSQYSVVFGIPLSLFGIIYFVAVIALVLANLAKDNRLFKQLLLIAETGGVLFSTYLVSLQIFVIKQICLYCMFSALICFLIFGLTVFQSQNHKVLTI
jgi:uncharacterized membrane protein